MHQARGASHQREPPVGTVIPHGDRQGPRSPCHLRVLIPGEGDISFPPTYRYERGTRDTYVWQKSKPTGVSSRVFLQARHLWGQGQQGAEGAAWGCSVPTAPSTCFLPKKGLSLFGVITSWGAGMLSWAGEPRPERSLTQLLSCF